MTKKKLEQFHGHAVPFLAWSVVAALTVGAAEPDRKQIAAIQPGLNKPGEHPLLPAIRWAKQELPAIDAIKDYSATFVKRETVNGRLGEQETMSVKIRHKPFSVYADFLGPASLRGQEVLYVEGQNEGRMWAHKAHIPTTLSVHPDSPVAMRNRRYPLTEIGLANLIRRLVAVGEQETQYGECEVKYFLGATLNGRTCTVIQVVHPKPRREFLYHRARIFVDDELQVPLRFESHDWPSEPGAPLDLLEEFTYLNLKLNPGFTDEDFSVKNPNYRFQN